MNLTAYDRRTRHGAWVRGQINSTRWGTDSSFTTLTPSPQRLLEQLHWPNDQWCGFSFTWKNRGWDGIFESQTASELTTVEILVCSLDFVLEHWKHGLRETVKWTPKGTRIHQRWVILIHFIEWTLNWAIFRLHNRLYFISHTKSYNAFKFSTAVCSDASLGCLCLQVAMDQSVTTFPLFQSK